MLLPIPQIPSQFSLSSDVHSSHGQLMHYLSKIIDSKSLHQSLPQICVNSQSGKEHFEQVSTHAGIISSWIFLRQLQVLKCQAIEVYYLPTEQCRVLQQCLSTHHSVYMCLRKTAIDVLHQIYSSVCHNRNRKSFLDAFDDGPVTLTHLVLVLLFCTTMHCQQFASRSLNFLHQFHRPLLRLHSSYFAEDGDFHVLRKCRNYALNQVWLFEKERSIMSASCDILRTTKVDINGIYLILQHFGSPHHNFRVISTNLSNQRPILRTSRKVYLLISFLSGHHLGMKHRRIGQICPITTSQKTEGKFRLIYHWAAYESRVLNEGKLSVVDLHVKERIINYI